MDRYEQLYRLYETYDTGTIRARRDFVDLFPPVDSRVALAYWRDASDQLERDRAEIRESVADDDAKAAMATIATLANRDQAFTALDLLSKYDRGVNVLVLDVDETLRSAGGTDNEIPRQTLHLLTEFHEAGVPIVVCTGQTLENVKGFLIQGLGNELVHSGDVSVVYEAGTGVFTPGHGEATKKLLYEELDQAVRDVFDFVRSHILADAPDEIKTGCHLQGNEFNVTLKPNFETGSEQAHDVIDQGLCYQMDLLGRAVATVLDAEADDDDGTTPAEWARAYYAEQDPEIDGVLTATDGHPDVDADDVPDAFRTLFEAIDVAYYEADAAEIGSLELNKVRGVEGAFDVLGLDDPFALVMGDSKSDLRVMRWVEEQGTGIAAAPEHASTDVLDHVKATDDLVFDRGAADDPLRMTYALNELANSQ
jgi:hydroxymethylpyrimidine pyrophosphatase-like HAD family hydrolase